MTLKVLICTLPGGVHLHNSVVEQMYREQPGLFNERFKIIELFGTDQHSREMVINTPHTIVIGDDAFELPMSIAVRSNPWLISKFEKEGSASLTAKGANAIKIVAIPQGIECYVYRYEDFAEEIHEQHRVWK